MSARIPEVRSTRVLVVDDDPVARVMASQTLGSLGFEVEEVASGQRALAAVRKSFPDLILLDIQMPVMDGFEVCTRLRANPANAHIPVLMATGLVDRATVDRAFNVGATDFIEKPIDWMVFQHRVRFMLRASQAVEESRRMLLELRESEQRLANAQRVAQMGYWDWVPGSQLMRWSDEMHRIFGIETGTVLPTLEAFLAAFDPEDQPAVEEVLKRAMSEERPDGKAWSLDSRVVCNPEGIRVVQQRAAISLGAEGGVERVTGTIQDVTDRRRSEEKIRQLAYFDSLTGLPNRKMLKEHLDRTIASAPKTHGGLALILFGLDRFKRVNETLGHKLGDDLVKRVGDRLLKRLRVTDRVGRGRSDDLIKLSRISGDEFTIVLNKAASPEDVAPVARRLLELIRFPFVLNGHEIVMGASIGIALHPADGGDADTLLRNAETALGQAKAAGGGCYRFFSGVMNKNASRVLTLERGLHAALKRGEFKVHYQPLLDARTGAFSAAEVLVRWNSPELGAVSPGEFIPVAEAAGLIPELGEWVLRTACSQMYTWQQEDRGLDTIAVNLSSYQLRSPKVLPMVKRALEDSGLQASALELEITESALIADEPDVMKNMAGLKELGIRLALDDFGTGYSSLSYLVRFPIDKLKIDRSFVSRIETEMHAREIISAVIAMAHRLHLKVTAEGVETEEQEKYLRAEGCDELQGFRFSRPLPAAKLEKLLEGKKAT